MNIIKLYKSYGYCEANLSDGGEGLRNPTKEIRQKMSKGRKGKKHTTKTKKILSKRAMNINNPNWRGGVITPGGIFNDIRSAANHFGCCNATIRKRCISDKNHWNEWRYVNNVV